MQIRASHNCEGIAHAASKFLNGMDMDVKSALADMTLHIGPSNDPEFRTPLAARDCLFVGDGAHLGSLLADEATKALYKQDKRKVALRTRWNSATNKWDVIAAKAANNFVGDAAPDLIAAQQISPWNQGFFSDIFERPLLYSHASDLVKRESGSAPWCEVMNLFLADYAGTAVGPVDGGSPENSQTRDITVTSGMMSAMVMNMYVTYSLTIEELEAAKSAGTGNPFGSSLIQRKVAYANYVLQMLTDYLTYYGNSDTDTQGLFQVNTVTAYAGGSIESIVNGSSATKGSTIYQKLSQVLNEFFTDSFNKFSELKIAMSTYAYNQLTSVPYSDNYEAKSALAVFEQNYNGGRNTKDTMTNPRITFYADPLLDANTDFNPTGSDYLVITAPTVGTGPSDTKKDIILQGMPLKEFVYPVTPGMVNTQHRMLRRYAGIYAPVSKSVKIYSGFGKSA